MGTDFGYVVLFKGYWLSHEYVPEGYTVRYEAPGENVRQNRTCATIPPGVVNRCAALDMVPEGDSVDGVGYRFASRGVFRYVLDLWAPVEDIFDLDPR